MTLAPSPSPAPAPARLHALDSLRGIAALTVLLGHILMVCEWDTRWAHMPLLNNLFDGRSAVTMFFVLSGFVLTYGSLRSSRPLLLVPFYIRRITRIWIPWLVAFCLSIAAKRWLLSTPVDLQPPLGHHYLLFWSQANSPLDLLRQSLFMLHQADKQFLPQDWSLGVELRGSLLIPLFLLLARRSWAWVAAAGMALWLIRPDGGYFYTSFAVGVWVASLSATAQGLKSGWLFALLGFVLYQVRWASGLCGTLSYATMERWVWLISSIGCGLIILGIMRSQALRTSLEHFAPVFLGKVSYSLFLLQMIVLLCVAPWLVAGLNHLGVRNPWLIQPVLLVALPAMVLALAALAERWIEVPCIRLGKVLTARIEKMPRLSRWRV